MDQELKNSWLKIADELVAKIESLGASVELTNAVTLASKLRHSIDHEVPEWGAPDWWKHSKKEGN